MFRFSLPFRQIFLALLFGFLFISCQEQNEILTDIQIIPIPNKLDIQEEYFSLNKKTHINFEGDDSVLPNLAEECQSRIEKQTGLKLHLHKNGEAGRGINLILNDEEGVDGSYRINISEGRIDLISSNEPGIFYALQSLYQIIPWIGEEEYGNNKFLIPFATIEDTPVYEYRGTMLDVSRHFFSVQDVKKYIDYLSSLKMNKLHLHLTDDQGWRIEIKSWPKLTEVGSKNEVGGGPGGFYTQEEYTDIVNYAASKYVTIIPEIDMPGHTNAALVSYPELDCSGRELKPHTGIEVGFSSFCIDKEIVYEFVDSVIRELAAITPGEYLHIGGDESHATEHDDYVKFMTRVQKIVEKHGKKSMGWDEIATSELAEGTVVHYWAGAENASLGINKNAKLLMSPANRTYMDMQYDTTTHLGLHWAAYIEADDAYNWEPTEFGEAITKENILGVEAPLWSETLETLDDIEYMAFPRISAIAEIAWAPKENRNWEDYSERLRNLATHWDQMGINYYKSKKVWIE